MILFRRRSLYLFFRIRFVLLFLMTAYIAGCGATHRTVSKKEPPPPEKPAPPQKEDKPPVRIKPKKKVEIINPNNIPETPREMRAAWIASVANIDWPSAPGLPVAQQKDELRAMMDRAVQLHLNAIILQVRPSADALYNSPYEPWSEFLTGKQGRPPKPFYDPLHFAVQEAHRRGLQLHAWFNPFRAYHYAAKNGFAPSFIKNTHPDWVKKYGRYYWLDPGNPAVRQYSMDVILDVARRYDIDGVHLDDYFYPYPQKTSRGSYLPFPDDASYQRYKIGYGPINRADWRRQNINRFIKKLHEALRKVKPHLLFGISPFGIWRPGHPAQIKGFDAYQRIYADSRKWLREGWVDYLSPQLYWPSNQYAQSFPVLLNWWNQQNVFHRHIWPGLYTNKLESTWKPSEIERQIQLIRQQEGTAGEIHFSMKTLMKNAGNIDKELLAHAYTDPALVPSTSWLSSGKPPQPDASLEQIGSDLIIALKGDLYYKPWLWVLKAKYGNHWMLEIIPGSKKSKVLPGHNRYGAFRGAVVSLVDRLSNESAPQMLLPLMEHIETTKSE